jgi:alanine racemase
LQSQKHLNLKKISYLSPETHRTVLEVDLNAFRYNLRYFRSKLRSNTKIVAMVKAFAYGVGISRLAQVLQEEKVDFLAVAYADEGLALRRIDITAPILVFNPEPNGFDNLVNFDMQPEIFSYRFFDTFIDYLKKRTLGKPYPIHIKLDTGMHRLGLLPEDMPAFKSLLEANLHLVHVASIFSHMAASESDDFEDFSVLQIQRFREMCDDLKSVIPYPVQEHILNTSGIERFPQAQLDMVRIGIGMFGISYVPEVQAQLKNVCTLKTRIAQIKQVKKGETIGYNRAYTAPRDMKIALLFIGYADGLPRALSNGKGSLWINGKLAPIVGNVCMDITMVDITDVHAEISDEVIVFGGPIPIDAFAKNLGTIAYEVLTDLSTRVRRVYLE